MRASAGCRGVRGAWAAAWLVGALVSVAAGAETGERAVQRVYDISYLTPGETPLLFFCRPYPGAVERMGIGRVAPQMAGRAWASLIRANIAPGTWRGSEREAAGQQPTPHSVAYRNGRLVVSHTEAVHKQIKAFLGHVRATRHIQVHILARFIEVPVAYADSLKLKWQAAGREWWSARLYAILAAAAAKSDAATQAALRKLARRQSLSLRVAAIGADPLNSLLDGVMKGRKGSLLIAPRLTCFNTQRANFQVAASTGRLPRVARAVDSGTSGQGIMLDVQPYVSPDQSTITLVIHPPTFRPPVPGERPQKPGSKERGVSVTVRNGGSVVLRWPGRDELLDVLRKSAVPLRTPPSKPAGRKEPRCVIVLLTAEVVLDIFSED